jgi:hypothetical protein
MLRWHVDTIIGGTGTFPFWRVYDSNGRVIAHVYKDVETAWLIVCAHNDAVEKERNQPKMED